MGGGHIQNLENGGTRGDGRTEEASFYWVLPLVIVSFTWTVWEDNMKLGYDPLHGYRHITITVLKTCDDPVRGAIFSCSHGNNMVTMET